MFIVQSVQNGFSWYLRGTVATTDPRRASLYPTQDDAQKALAKARKFIKPDAYKAAQIVLVAVS